MGNPQERCDVEYEYIIVGAGPAGIQSAYYLEKSGRNYAILESGPDPGTSFKAFPRHRTLISINKRYNSFPEDDYNMRHDWNSLLSDDTDLRFTKYSDKLFPPADTLVEYLADFVKKFNIKIIGNTHVTKIKKEKNNKGGADTFVLKTKSGPTYRAQVVIMACGAMREKLPDVPGVELCQTYAKHNLDQDYYINKKICIVGGGNSGFETADHLAGHAAIVHVHNSSPFKLAWDTHFPGHLRAINNSIIDMFHLKSIHGLRHANTKKIEEVNVNGKRMLKMYYDTPLPHWSPPSTAHLHDTYDEIIFCTGWYYVDPEMFDENCRPETSPCGKYPMQKPTWESTNVDNLFFAGTCTQGRDRKAASSFIHGFRYSARTLMQLLNHWRHNVPLQMKTFNSINLEDMAKHIIQRVSTTSALYQLNYGVLCDIIVFKPNFEKGTKTSEDGPSFAGAVDYYYELPTEWALDQNKFSSLEHMWVLIMKDHKTSFNPSMGATDFSVPPRLMETDQPCQGFIQPVVRRYKYGEMLQEFALGANFVVRLDQHQLSADNNPQRTTNKLKNLVCKELGIGGANFDENMYDDESLQTMFTPWTEEQIAAEHMRIAEKASKPCDFKINPKAWKRKGQDIILAEQ